MAYFEKGKPVERRGRKATGLKQGHCDGSRVTEDTCIIKQIAYPVFKRVSIFIYPTR